jgi:hypothetical protein
VKASLQKPQIGYGPWREDAALTKELAKAPNQNYKEYFV